MAGTTIKLKKYAIRELYQGIQRLDGRAVSEKDSDGKIVVTVKPFEITDKTLYALAKTAEHLRPVMAAIDKVLKAKQIEKDKTEDEKEDEIMTFLDGDADVEVHKTNRDGLKAEKNHLPPVVLSWLLPMLEGVEE